MLFAYHFEYNSKRSGWRPVDSFAYTCKHTHVIHTRPCFIPGSARMNVHAEIATLIYSYEDRILRNMFTKADFTYHNIKQSLHNMWAKIYVLEKSDERTASIKKIHECLVNLEKRVVQNEQKKYLNYYAHQVGISNKIGKRVLIGRSM